jgi:hypothetical protein
MRRTQRRAYAARVSRHQLAQCNIARLRAPLDSPLLAEFVASLEPINALAERAPGFVWRLQTEDGDATAIRAFDDDMILVNMSVWDSIEALASFTYSGDHRAVMRRRREWFDRMTEAYLVLWWIPGGTHPSVADARVRLELLRASGPSPDAFTFRSRFDPSGAATADGTPEGWLCPT